jgi:hypothetical protein
MVYYNNFVSVMMYLLARVVFKHKMLPETWLRLEKFPPEEETIFAQRHLIAQFQNTFVPFAVNLACFYIPIPAPFSTSKRLRFQLIFQACNAGISMCCQFFILFIDYKKGPKLWTTVAPYMYLCMLWWMLLISPTLNIIC